MFGGRCTFRCNNSSSGTLNSTSFAGKCEHDAETALLDHVLAWRCSLTVPPCTTRYGAWFDEGMGYRNDNTTGLAVGNEPESMYAVMGGNHYNDFCW